VVAEILASNANWEWLAPFRVPAVQRMRPCNESWNDPDCRGPVLEYRRASLDPPTANRPPRGRRIACDKARHERAVMLHLLSRYVSKAAILTVPALPVPVENRSPA